MNYILKIDECFLKAKLEGFKLFEIRENDRGYQKGDTVTYSEYPIAEQEIKHTYEITYVTAFRQIKNYVVFGERHLESKQGSITLPI